MKNLPPDPRGRLTNSIAWLDGDVLAHDTTLTGKDDRRGRLRPKYKSRLLFILDRPVEEGGDHPRISTDGSASVAVAPPPIVVHVEDGSGRNHADPQRVVRAAAGWGHERRRRRGRCAVSEAEAEQVTRQAAASGLSVSAYLRDRALGVAPDASESAALRQVDAFIDRIEADLDSAIAEVSATIARMGAVA
jgi:hypothetical protein